MPLREKISHFETSPITGIHLWFDRQISDLDHAVLLDRTVQWMFHKSRLLAARATPEKPESGGSYIELVVSASKNLIDKSRTEIVELGAERGSRIFPRGPGGPSGEVDGHQGSPRELFAAPRH